MLNPSMKSNRAREPIISRGLSKVAVYRDPKGESSRALRRLPASRLHRQLEHAREYLGLSLPRLALRRAGQSNPGTG